MGFAAVAQSRPEKPLPGMDVLLCVRCGARNYFDAEEHKEFVCWRCNLDHGFTT
jgi:ribosomal protein L40E